MQPAHLLKVWYNEKAIVIYIPNQISLCDHGYFDDAMGGGISAYIRDPAASFRVT